MLKIAKIKFIPMRQQSRQRNSFFSRRFTSNLMLPACLLGMILVANEEKSLKFLFAKQISRNLDKKECLRGASAADVACNYNVTLALLVTSLTL